MGTLGQQDHLRAPGRARGHEHVGHLDAPPTPASRVSKGGGGRATASAQGGSARTERSLPEKDQTSAQEEHHSTPFVKKGTLFLWDKKSSHINQLLKSLCS